MEHRAIEAPSLCVLAAAHTGCMTPVAYVFTGFARGRGSAGSRGGPLEHGICRGQDSWTIR